MKHLHKLSLLLLVLLLPATAIAHDFEVDGIYYNIVNDDEVSVTYKGTSYSSGAYSGPVTIPATVTYGGTTYSVNSIGSHAFYNCSGLTSITIPNSVTSIGGSAFSGCIGLTSIEIPNSVTTIGSSAFYNTPWYNNQPEGLVYAGNVAYKYKGTMPSGTSITLREGTLGISDYAFSSCTGLTSITIPSSLTSIGEGSFNGCSGLTRITVDTNNSHYDSRNNCNAIIETASNTLISGCMNTVIPNSVTTIGHSAFRGCSSLISIDIPNSVTSIGAAAFEYCSGLTSITIPNFVTIIGNSAFSGCSGLTSVSIPNSVTSIGEHAFYRCSGLTSIDIPNSVTSIGDYAFYDCSSLTDVIIGNSVTSIGACAFADCSGLTSITIPNSVTSIGDRAFYQCTSLASISITNTNFDISLGKDVFFDTAWYNNQPDGVVYIGLIAYRYKGIEPENSSITLRDGTIGIAGYAFYDCSGLTSISIPNSVTSIGDRAFSRSGLTRVIIPNSVTYIGDYAFSNSALTSVTIFNSATYIGEGVFSECIGLTSVTLPYTIKTIVPFMFYGCMRLTQIDIPNSVTTIGDFAFFGCIELTQITIPNSVKYIGALAFSDCYNLLSVTIGNSVNYIGGGAFGCQGWFGDYIFGRYCNLTSIVVADGNSTYDSRNSCNAIIETASNTLVVGGINTTIPKTVTSIGNFAFEGCCPREMYIPNSVISIGDYAFYNCNGPNRITIPNSVTYIGNEAFGHNEFFNWGWDPEVFSYIIEPSQVTFGDDVFQWWEFSPPLHVPYGSTQAYQADSKWNMYFHYFEEIELVTSIALNATMTSMNVGKTFQLSATVLPNNAIKTVTWTSSNTNVATVDADGLVTAHAIGTATITAMTTDGSNLSATCTVKVPAAGLTGDVDGDGNVSITDVTTLIDAILNGNNEGVYFESADLNLNGRLDIGDVTTIIDMLLNGE